MKLAVLDPGHFHAALVQKRMYPGIDPTVRVYAPGGPDLDDYLRRVQAFNARPADPTQWRVEPVVGPDYLERFAGAGDIDLVVIAGNNARKAEYLAAAVGAGIHTLGDKPMAIDTHGYAALERSFATARARDVLLYDIMTERFEITTILQRDLTAFPDVFGALERGTPDDPAVTKVSVHHIAKLVAGAPIVRPAWFFDTAQQGEGLVDITTHLVDLVQWACFPEAALEFRADVRVLGARRWPTRLAPREFTAVTGLEPWPEFLRKDVAADGALDLYANGRIDYALRGVHARVEVLWHYEAAPGAGDSHASVMRGTRASLEIRQGEAERHQPTLYIVPRDASRAWDSAVRDAARALQGKYPGIDLAPAERGHVVRVPARYHVGHEAHFGQVAEAFLRYVEAGALPAWEMPGMLTKYATTTQALALARK